MAKDILKIAGEKIYPGQRKRVEIEFASMFDYTQINIPVEVIRGSKPGPRMFICAAIHGDELNGVEIIKRLLAKPSLKKLRGDLIIIPVVNIFGFNTKSRYLPDRRDLNRCFPGNPKGSMGSRLAHVFMKEIVKKCDYGIDLHTGAIHRTNMPQIRACLDDEEIKELAESFGVPVIINSNLRDGSLRSAAQRKSIKMLLYEGGEALRFEEPVIKAGIDGCMRVLRKVGMLPPLKKPSKKKKVYAAQESYWLRAPHSGSFRIVKNLGDRVEEGDVVAVISDTFGENPFEVLAKEQGIVIGLSCVPLVNKGDAIIHIAVFKNSKKVKDAIITHDN